MAFPTLEEFSNVLKHDERLLRGGYLDKPRVIASLEMLGGRAFFKVCQRNNVLRHFLTGQTSGSSPLQGHLAVFLAKLRDAKQGEWSMDGAGRVVQDAVPDSLGSELASDDTLRAPTKNNTLTPQRKKALLKQFKYVIVQFPFGNEVADLAIKTVRHQSEQPAVEATMANFRALHCWCEHNAPLYQAVADRPKRAASIKPRKTVGGSEYWRKFRKCVYKMSKQRKTSLSKWIVRESRVVVPRKRGRPWLLARGAPEAEPSLADESASASASSAELATEESSEF
jgi:hypothetical protein